MSKKPDHGRYKWEENRAKVDPANPPVAFKSRDTDGQDVYVDMVLYPVLYSEVKGAVLSICVDMAKTYLQLVKDGNEEVANAQLSEMVDDRLPEVVLNIMGYETSIMRRLDKFTVVELAPNKGGKSPIGEMTRALFRAVPQSPSDPPITNTVQGTS